MNTETTLTRSQQRIAQLINCGRPLTEAESDELFRALHADYMRKWRLARSQNELKRQDLAASNTYQAHLLDRLRMEAAQPEWHAEETR
jgi:ribosome-binding protein aMBF1 (putative translation factor)